MCANGPPTATYKTSKFYSRSKTCVIGKTLGGGYPLVARRLKAVEVDTVDKFKRKLSELFWIRPYTYKDTEVVRKQTVVF